MRTEEMVWIASSLALPCANALRLSQAMTRLHVPAALIAPELLSQSPSKEGAGNAGCPLHPQPHVQVEEARKCSHHRFIGKQPDTPCAMVLRLIARSPRRSGFLVTVIGGNPRRFDSGVEESGPRDFTGRDSSLVLQRYSRPSHPALHVRDDAQRPSCERGTGLALLLFLPKRETKYFFLWSLT
jgi:hypothetical protein